MSDKTPQYGHMTPSSSTTGLHKCDIWDASTPAKEPHHQFSRGRVIPRDADNGRDTVEIKLHCKRVSESPLPGDLAGLELLATDSDGEQYEATITTCETKGRHVYLTIPAEDPVMFVP